MEQFETRDLKAFSAEPLLVFPTHYTGDAGYISDTETSTVWDNEKVRTDWDRGRSGKTQEQAEISTEAQNSDVLQSTLDSTARDELWEKDQSRSLAEPEDCYWTSFISPPSLCCLIAGLLVIHLSERSRCKRDQLQLNLNLIFYTYWFKSPCSCAVMWVYRYISVSWSNVTLPCLWLANELQSRFLNFFNVTSALLIVHFKICVFLYCMLVGPGKRCNQLAFDFLKLKSFSLFKKTKCVCLSILHGNA